MTIVRILYDENNLDYDLSYRGVEVVFHDEIRTVFTGDVVEDFRKAIDHAKAAPPIALSSTCDHFTMDFNQFRWNKDDMIVARKE